MKKFLVVLLVFPALLMAGCLEQKTDQERQVDAKAKNFKAYLPQNDVELQNYNAAQKLYDSPDSIIWCTTTWGNPSAPLVTVPITGKLTSSSTSFFAPDKVDSSSDGNVVRANRSVDGLFHPNPPGYRYGFTPGGQYVDFFNMDTFCTTALTKFQREKTEVSVSTDSQAKSADGIAQEALRRGDKAGAQEALKGLESGN